MTTPLVTGKTPVFPRGYIIPGPDNLFDQGCTLTMRKHIFDAQKNAHGLPLFPRRDSAWDLITYFTLTEHDGALIDTYLGDTNRLGAAPSTLCCALASDFASLISIPHQAT